MFNKQKQRKNAYRGNINKAQTKVNNMVKLVSLRSLPQGNEYFI